MTTGDNISPLKRVDPDFTPKPADADTASLRFAPKSQAAPAVARAQADPYIANVTRRTLPQGTITVAGLAGTAITALTAVLLLLDSGHAAGRAICAVAMALVFWIAVEWWRRGAGVQLQSGRNTDLVTLATLEKKIEQLEDAKWELEEARDQAQIANRSKSRFLASMSHEIRTPMNGIMGMASLLAEGRLTKQQQTYVNAIELSARNLLKIIDEILDFSKIEAGKVKLTGGYLSLEDITQSVVELLAPSAQEKGLEIAWTVDHSARGEFYGDSSRVRQILLNLVTNAVKFTDTGGVRVAVTSEIDGPDDGEPAGPRRVSIRVSDTGVGLAEEDLDTLFFEFSQTDEALRRQAGGTGLGLAISQRLAEAMGGGLSVESDIGEGSTFIVKMVLHPVSGAMMQQRFETQDGQPHMKVMLAFDRQLERQALVDVLKDAGIDVVACNLQSACEMASREVDAGEPITRVIVDSEADPDLAETLLHHVTRLGAASGLDAGDVRGLVLVNVLTRDNLPVFQNLGFDAYLVRPVRPRTVFEQLNMRRCSAQKGNPGSDLKASGESGVENARPLHFLLVEDNDINALLVEQQVKSLGHSVVRALDGEAAVSQVQQSLSGDVRPFDAVLMDVMLPVMDGFEATAEIRALWGKHHPSLSHLPVIALTANAFEEDKQRCLEAGMDDYLAKPFDRDMLQTVLLRCLKSGGTSDLVAT